MLSFDLSLGMMFELVSLVHRICLRLMMLFLLEIDRDRNRTFPMIGKVMSPLLGCRDHELCDRKGFEIEMCDVMLEISDLEF